LRREADDVLPDSVIRQAWVTSSRVGKNLGFKEFFKVLGFKVFLGRGLKVSFFAFGNFIFCKALLGVVYLRYGQYVKNPTAATPPKVNSIVTRK